MVAGHASGSNQVLMRRLNALSAIALFLCAGAGASGQAHDPDEGSLSSIKPEIPEPMVFDLVRPLGAEKGEVEVNSLFIARPGGRARLNWAPEVEWCFAEGYTVEFELPIENTRIESYKFALQGMLPRPKRSQSRLVHGWQTIVETDERGKHPEWPDVAEPQPGSRVQLQECRSAWTE